MPISGVSTDYSARTKDLHIFQGVNRTGFAQITPSFGNISNYCTGIQKLVQRYAICLLTQLGTQSNYPEFGTDLVSTLTRGSNLNVLDIYPIFNAANIQVISLFREYQRATPNLLDDEKLSTAVLEDIIVEQDNVGLSIQIYPMTDGPVEFILPIPSN